MADSPDDLLTAARQALYDWTIADDGTEAEWNASARLNSAFEMLDHLMIAGGPLPAAWKRPPVTPAVLAERDAQMARLTAELDATRAAPVEYVMTAGLEAAMAADPHRPDGSILRATDGKRTAWVWRAAAKTWEPVTVPGDTPVALVPARPSLPIPSRPWPGSSPILAPVILRVSASLSRVCWTGTATPAMLPRSGAATGCAPGAGSRGCRGGSRAARRSSR